MKLRERIQGLVRRLINEVDATRSGRGAGARADTGGRATGPRAPVHRR